jgi:hypothetical protein
MKQPKPAQASPRQRQNGIPGKVQQGQEIRPVPTMPADQQVSPAGQDIVPLRKQGK